MTKDEKSKILPEGYEFNLSDFALFLAVMKNREAYESTLSLILEEPELKLAEVKVEQVVLNKSGKRAIRLDAWAKSEDNRQFNMEMQNDSRKDSIPKRSRYYQGLIDTPVLKAGKETQYKHLPSTDIIFITQEDIFGKDLTKYTFTEQCEEIRGLHLEDGTRKIFLNMSSKNGSKELVSLLQYMKKTDIRNPDITVKDERLLALDRIVTEVRESEEWEAVQMNILEVGIEHGREEGIKEGIKEGVKVLVETCVEFGVTKSDTLQRLEEKFSLSKQEAEVYLEKYWTQESGK